MRKWLEGLRLGRAIKAGEPIAARRRSMRQHRIAKQLLAYLSTQSRINAAAVKPPQCRQAVRL